MWSDFLRSALLLALTAALTGVLVPIITKTIDDRRSRQRTEFEAEVARQSKIIDSQAAWLDRFAETVWEFQLLLLAPAYYRQFPSQHERYQVTVAAYLDSADALLGRVRAEVSKSLRFASRDMYNRLNELYSQKLLGADLALTQLIESDRGSAAGAEMAAWRQFLETARDDLAADIDETLAALGSSFGFRPTGVP